MSEEPQITWYHAEIKTGPVPHQITTTSGPAFAAFLRSIADTADPPKRPMRGRGFEEEKWTPPETFDPNAPILECATDASACPHLALCLVDKTCKFRVPNG